MNDPKRFDILGDLLRGRERSTDETVTIEKMIHGRGEELTLHDRPGRQPETRLAKVKTTYYLSETTYDALEDARQAIAQLMPEAVRHRVTRSLLVELAIRIVLRDFEKKGRESALYQWLVRGFSKAAKR